MYFKMPNIDAPFDLECHALESCLMTHKEKKLYA